ncbi:SPOSA6832_00909 [Sporobolomyces salmonicolor]|uniref:SPOSA6832_00909-mRNA-1:cds n=1 Tax=Sporidiobolus salmonicolor TaxID=5005 RepID=A0A0D6EHF8_SPOSA|nr:SPOSA6832_00909 [Sporobolomyces salmonicolor]
MQTRRTTRRSLAAEQGVENDLSNRVSSRSAATGLGGAVKPQAAQKPLAATTSAVGGSRRTAATGKTLVVDKTASTSTAGATRKRSAFSDVTNGGKAKNAAGTSVPTKAASKAASSSTSTVRRTYRTRSSVGGTSAIKEAPAEDEQEAGDEPSDAMAIDDAEVDEKRAVRNVKPLRRSAAVAASKAFTSTSTAGARRPALAVKRANSTTTSRSTSGVAAKAGKVTPAAVRAARRRREEAEAKHQAALAELEAARKQEEEELEQHRAKKLRTSEPEYLREMADEDEEGEEAELAEEEERRVCKYEVEVEGDGARAKDEGWEDLDAGDEEDPLMVSAYVVEVYEYLRELELTTMPDPEYMTNQNEVTWKMRGILVDWLVEIHTKFRLLPETIFLAVNIIDRFLSVRVVSLVKFQLVGVTALFIAAKYEEVVCPSVSNFLYMTDGGYTDDEILKAERYVLGIIGFNLSYPNPINFLRRISKADGYDIQSRTMAKYLMEISIVDHRFMATPPSLIAAGASWLARKVLGKGHWDANLVHYSGYSEAELKPTAQLMLNYVVRTSSVLAPYLPDPESGESPAARANPLQMSPVVHEVEHPNFIKKYSAKKFFKASTAMRKWAEDEYNPNQYRGKAADAVSFEL